MTTKSGIQWIRNELRISPKTAERLRLEFMVGLHEAHLKHFPNDIHALNVLGHAYTKLGEYEKGLMIDKNLVKLCPKEPIFHYNLACSYSLLGDIDKSIRALQRAIGLGYDDLETMEKDSDLNNIRQDARYENLVASLKRKKALRKKDG